MTDTKHSGELATCDFCRASEVPVLRKYLHRANKGREIGDGFTITRYCHECGLENETADTKHTDSVDPWDFFIDELEPFGIPPQVMNRLCSHFRTTLQATHQQQVEAMSPDIREDFYKWFTARKGQKDIADWWLARTSQQVEEAVERVAKAIYAEMVCDDPRGKPDWVPGGNSIKQNEARRKALQAIVTPNHQD